MSLGLFRHLGRLVRPGLSLQVASRSLVATAPCLGGQEDLERAKVRVTTLSEDPGNAAKLRLYGLYKQATQGTCTTKKPGAFDFVGKAKWEAWNSLGDLSKSSAVDQYCQYVDELVGSQPQTSDSAADPSAAGSDYEHIVVSNEGRLRTILMNRPAKYNALNFKMYGEIQQALEDAGRDGSVAVTVITGAGDYYCSGNDLSNFATIPPEGPQKLAAEGRQTLLHFVNAYIQHPKPLIALVNGPAVGVSVTLLGLCDLVYTADHATFHTPFMELGQSPEACSSYIFPRIMGAARANEMLLGGRKITAVEAYERGLVTRVIPKSEFQSTVKEITTRMASLPPKSLQKSKELIRRVDIGTLEKVNAEECELLEERWLSDECMEAILKFMQRKK